MTSLRNIAETAWMWVMALAVVVGGILFFFVIYVVVPVAVLFGLVFAARFAWDLAGTVGR